MTTVVFRADASSAIGSGHVTRCMALAQALSERGAHCHFIARELPREHESWLTKRGFTVHRLPGGSENQGEDARQSRRVIESIGGCDWLVADHYNLDIAWESQVRSCTASILTISDLPDRTHDCDILLDQNLVTPGSRGYAPRVPAHCRQLLGPRYALLRPEFASIRRAGARQRGRVERLFICFGGSDEGGYTTATMEALRLLESAPTRIDVVLGAAHRHSETIRDTCRTIPGAVIHHPAENVAELLSLADLAVGAGGTMNWERACLGVPALVFGVVANQREVLSSLISMGCVLGSAWMPTPDTSLISHWLAVTMANEQLLRGLAERSSHLVDGLGASRVAEQMLPNILQFRAATMKDGADLLEWRNAAEVRAASSDSSVIDPSGHSAWLEGVLSHPGRILLIAEHEGRPIGVVRFDLTPRSAVISVYRTPKSRGRSGLVRQSAEWLRQNHPEITHIVAEVRAGNERSLAAFRTAGYRDVRVVLELEVNEP